MLILTHLFSNSGDYLISTGKDSKAIFWNIEKGELVHEFVGHTAEVTIADFNFDSSLWITGSQDMKVLLWSTSSGELLSCFDSFIGVITWIEFNKDDNLFYVWSSDATWNIYNADNLEIVYNFSK